MPDPSDSNPVVRLSKWVGVISGIVGALAVLVTGIWQVGALLNDLKDTRTELASLETSFRNYQEEVKTRNEIQAEILVNLRIAVAAIQAASAARTPIRTATRPAVNVAGGVDAARASTSLVRRPSPVGTASTPERPSPQVAALIRTLPRLPPPLVPTVTPMGTVLVAGATPESQARALEVHENETVAVALQRAMILQDQL